MNEAPFVTNTINRHRTVPIQKEAPFVTNQKATSSTIRVRRHLRVTQSKRGAFFDKCGESSSLSLNEAPSFVTNKKPVKKAYDTQTKAPFMKKQEKSERSAFCTFIN